MENKADWNFLKQINSAVSFDYINTMEKIIVNSTILLVDQKKQIEQLQKENEYIKSELQNILDEEPHGEMCERLTQSISSDCDCFRKRIRSLLNGK